MSRNLYWRPPAPPPPGNPLPYGLKALVARYVWDHDGSLHSDPVLADGELVPFLRGILAATGNPETSEGARELLDAIAAHGAVEIFIT